MSKTEIEPSKTRIGPYEGNYLDARRLAFQRVDYTCQMCGSKRAEETHHWALSYPTGDKVKADDLIALCITCHYIVTTLRGLTRAGCSRDLLDAEFTLAVEDRKRWQALLTWIRTAMSSANRASDGQQNSAIQTLISIAHEQTEKEVQALRREIASTKKTIRLETRDELLAANRKTEEGGQSLRQEIRKGDDILKLEIEKQKKSTAKRTAWLLIAVLTAVIAWAASDAQLILTQLLNML